MNLGGFVYKLGDSVNTDLIISGRYKFSITDMKQLSRHVFEDIDPDFYSKLKHGSSIIVAGENFGMGSSREQAPLVIKEAGIVAVVAKSFARIFFRNAFNVGLPLIETDTSGINERDELEIDLEKGTLSDLTNKKQFEIKPLPKVMMRILNDGGLVAHFKKYGRIEL